MDATMQSTHFQEKGATNTTRQILFVAAMISTLFGSLYFLGLLGKYLVDGSIHSVSAPPIQMVSAAIGLLWDATLLILFVALSRQISKGYSIYAELSWIFMALVCATSSINWFVQLSLVPRIAQIGDAMLLSLVDIHGDSSIMYAIEHLAWGLFVGLSMIFMAVAMKGDRLETWIRWLFLAGGVLSLLHVFGIIFDSHPMLDLGYFAAGVLLPIATALLAVRFRRE
jgi:hypothetical protein